MSHANRQIDAHLQHGKRLHGSGRLAEAGQVYQQVLSAAPLHPEALDMMGVLVLQTGQPAQALEWVQRAIAIKATVPDFHVHHAHALLALGLAAEAVNACRTALGLKRGNAEAQQALGHALTDTGDYEGALKAYQDAARLKPDLPDLMNNLGTAQHHANRLEEAVRTLTRAHGREPNEPGILINLANSLKDVGRFEEADARLAAAFRLAPGDPRVRYNQALLWLVQGRFTEAWPGWEERFRVGAARNRGLTKPVWRGEPLNGRTLLIHAEQGLGDTIQFCRYPFPTDGNVVLEVRPELTRLIASRKGAPRIVAVGEALPQFDLTCALMGLPAIHATTAATIPSEVPYLWAPAAESEAWRARLAALPGRKVGLVWSGNPVYRSDRRRSIPPALLAALATVADISFVSLQKGIPHDARPSLPMADWTGELNDVADTAALIMGLDLIISVDTMVAHLASSLGRPVWLLNRFDTDWRWMRDREDSPWYPTMRIIRQPVPGAWEPVIAMVADALTGWVGGELYG
jgi:Flp pilus assembly protein TadD